MSERVEEPVEGDGLCMDGRLSERRRPRIDEIAVVIPLDVVDPVLGEKGVHLGEHMPPGADD